jgi:FkbM family methyltransferase
MGKVCRRMQEKAQKLLRQLRLEKTVRECYKHSIPREIIWRVRKAFQDDKKCVKDIGDCVLAVKRFNRGIDKDIWLHSAREEASTNLLESEIQEGMFCIDIGSNIGYYAVKESVLAGKCGCVLAVEPLQSCFDRLEQNIERNELENVETFNLAIAESDSGKELLIRDEKNISRILNDSERREYREVRQVESKKLVQVVKGKPDFIRMDLEGFESVLIPQIDDLDVDNLKLFLEVHPDKMEDIYGMRPSDFWRELSELGFRLKYVIRHDILKPSYFLRTNHPPRKVKKVDIKVEKALEQGTVPNPERPYRVFLEK